MLIDTEGLSSAENNSLSKESNNRDNKLTTFVIALSDLILINSFGENSTAITNLFPMVGKCIAELSQYQSKGAKLVPKIYFVHQATNIASGNAS